MNGGNYTCAPMVKKYFKPVKKEQSIAHIISKQATSLFLTKLKAFCCYIDEHLRSRNLSVAERFIYLRVQVFFLNSVVAGDPEHDLGQCITQEVKSMPDNEGFLLW